MPYVIGFMAMVLFLALVGPLLTIWALNTIFPCLAIPTTIWTYLAIAWLHTIIYYKHTTSSK